MYPIGFGQTRISEVEYDSLKQLGLINNVESYFIEPEHSLHAKSAGYLPPDSSFNVAIAPSDDGSSAVISLPFNFCFYGNPESELYINNNGNVSFGGIFTSSTPFNFPFAGFKVIAPFWSDVDTRARGGVFYKLLPNALIVNWEDVGHFNSSSSRGNSYQLILTDGTSELLPFGYTVGFFYNKLEWTAGDASGGSSGFGGAPAIAGINAGDGVKYAQAGKYDKADTTFVNSVDSLNGIANLIGQSTFFNPCDSINQKPGLMGYKLRDTIGVCVGDTMSETYRFLPPEFDQTAYSILTSATFPGFTLQQSSSGAMATASIEVIGSVSNMGFHTISFKVVDSGSPNQILDFEVVVQIDSLPQPLNIIGDTLICSYDTATLSVIDVYDSYLWNTSATDTLVNAVPGNYELTVTYNNCESSVTHNVGGYLPPAFITSPFFICYPDSVLLDAPPNLDGYAWSTSDTLAQIVTDIGGLYFLTVTNNGCVNSDSAFINDSVYVKINTSNINSCNGDSVILSVPDYYDQVLWSTGETTNSIKVLAGTYSVIADVFSGLGTSCQVFDTMIISDATIIPITLTGDSFICGLGSTQMQVVDNYASYSWDNGGDQQSNTFNTSGYHSVTVTSGTCSDSLGFTITPKVTPFVGIAAPLFYCDNVDSARLVAVGGPWDSLYWNTGETTDTIYSGFGWKKVTVWQDGCSNFADHPVNELINGVDVQGITEICPGQGTRLDVEFGFDLYEWSNGNIGFSTLVTAPGDYWCVVHLDSCSAATDTVTITMNTPDTVDIFGDTVMCDSSGGVLFANLSYTQFNWSTGERTPSISYTSPGIYSVTVQDPGFCVTSDTIEVVRRPSANPQIVGDSHYCFLDSTLLDAGTFESYLWSNGDTVSPLMVRAGVHSVTVTNSFGCKGIDKNFRVTQSAPEANIYSIGTACEGELIQVFTDFVGSKVWSSGDFSDTIFVLPQSVSLEVTDQYNCKSDSTQVFIPLPSPRAGIRMDPITRSEAYVPVRFNDESELNGANIISWYWNINDSIESFSMDTSLTFYEGMLLQVTHALVSDNGCSDSITLSYRITDDIVKVNIITPNGDGINDYLAFPNLQKYPNNHLHIFNRWGVEIGDFYQYQNYWDAYDVPEGTYYYVLELGENQPPVKGSFTILR